MVKKMKTEVVRVLEAAGVTHADDVVKAVASTEVFMEQRLMPAFLRAYCMMGGLNAAFAGAGKNGPVRYTPWVVKDDALTAVGLDADAFTIGIFCDILEGAFFLWIPEGSGVSHDRALQSVAERISETIKVMKEEYSAAEKEDRKAEKDSNIAH